ncbi:DUF3800 domain-containing protein [Bradyrhizobium sp. Pear77]|uniref:hypothetical protein n=1 Tax=Bradyrhizobium altum TaxID=1571202 RepID=UPI001E2C5D57|nr:hypothetical protein [Bradyrhizobium altum]MCC8953133.1 DUF3800 domain-containing protein [Bradyrhizobium altum]
MHIAIDDTYGPLNHGTSRYITGKRRTQVGVLFDDSEVEHIRGQVNDCLAYIRERTGEWPDEFHFVDIYNRKGVWERTEQGLNLRLFEAFAAIYSSYRWPVMIQTVDERTVSDLKGLDTALVLEGLDPKDYSQIALSLLCLRIRIRFKGTNEPLTLLLDEGLKKAGKPFGDQLFRNWPSAFVGRFASSKSEGLLQIADFLAFCINRNTHLALKAQRTELDHWFLQLVSDMRIDSPDLSPFLAKPNFSTADLDEFHRRDRTLKGIED